MKTCSKCGNKFKGPGFWKHESGCTGTGVAATVRVPLASCEIVVGTYVHRFPFATLEELELGITGFKLSVDRACELKPLANLLDNHTPAVVAAAPAKIGKKRGPYKKRKPVTPPPAPHPKAPSTPAEKLESGEDQLNKLEDQQLKDRIGVAKARGDQLTVNRCLAVLRRREIAANTIGREDEA